MALISSETFDSGLELSNAYVKIIYFSGVKEDIQIYVGLFLNKQARLDNKEALSTETYRYNLDLNSPDNILKQMYLQLKLEPKYVDAIDDLED